MLTTLLVAMDELSVRYCALVHGAQPTECLMEQASLDRWSQVLSAHHPTRVLACADSDTWKSEWSAFCQSRWQLVTQWPTAPDTAMSATRWAALSAVRSESGAHVVVHADRFTIIDGLAADGQYQELGVLPGTALMQSALYQKTKGIQSAAEQDAAVLGDFFARNTAGGVQAGAHQLSVAWIDEVVSQFKATQATAVTVWLTGSQAAGMAPIVPSARYCPELALRGLVQLATSTL
jgi:hypothetical protein